MNSFNNISRSLKNPYIKYGLISISVPITYQFVKNKVLKSGEKDSRNKDKKNKEERVNIDELKLEESRHYTQNFNIPYVKNQIENSIQCQDIEKLSDAIELLEGIISGYEILNKKEINPEYHIDDILYKLNKYRIKAYYNLGDLHLVNYQIVKANYNFIKSLKSCDESDSTHHKYINYIFDKLERTRFIC